MMKLIAKLEKENEALRDEINEILNTQFIDKKRVQELWSCSGQTVERAAKEGRITKYYLEGQRVVRYKLSEVMQAMRVRQS